MGHYLLHQSQERAQDWILILDESVEFGHSSLLVILGIRQSQLPEDRPLQAQDMACLFIGKASSWKGLDISHILNQLQQQLGRVIYVVSDKGNNLKKAIDLVNWQRVYDLNHFIAGKLKRLYEKNEAYQRFHKAATHMRRYQCLSKAACLLPPVQRAKARFLNVDKLCTWGRKILQLLDRLNMEDPMYKAVQWVKQHQPIIKELHAIFQIANPICSLLKKAGINAQTIAQCEQILNRDTDYPSVNDFRQAIQSYLSQIQQQFTVQMKQGAILCSSDIIESIFGRYKSYFPTNAMIGITDTALSIALFTNKIDQQNLKKGLSSISTQQLKHYSKHEFGQSIVAQRQKLLRNEIKRISKNGEVELVKSA